jgi:hypothetical protein
MSFLEEVGGGIYSILFSDQNIDPREAVYPVTAFGTLMPRTFLCDNDQYLFLLLLVDV